MERIAIAGNIEAPIFHLIIEKGYTVEVNGEYFIAKRKDLEIIANNLIELAGIIFLRENKGKNWKVKDNKIEDYIQFLNEKLK